jgi:hypothetical protein
MGCKPAAKTLDESEFQSLSSQSVRDSILSSVKCIIPAPPPYKWLWLGVNHKDNKLGIALMQHYMGCSGSAFNLSEKEFRNLPLAIIIRSSGSNYFSRNFFGKLHSSGQNQAGSLIGSVDESVIAKATYGNTLGNFTLKLKGSLKWKMVNSGSLIPRFEGKAKVRDNYDFNPSGSTLKNSWRGEAEARVRIAHVALPGKAFAIESDWFDFSFDFPYGNNVDDGPNEFVGTIQRGKYQGTGYSDFGKKVIWSLVYELNSGEWDKASASDKIRMVVATMLRFKSYFEGSMPLPPY